MARMSDHYVQSHRDLCAGETAHGFAEIEAQKNFLSLLDEIIERRREDASHDAVRAQLKRAIWFLQDIANMAEAGKRMPGCETAAHALAQLGVPRERHRDALKNEVVTDYWHRYYCTVACSLCGNSGVIDSRGKKTAAGVSVGRRNWCLCPNGQEARHFSKGLLPPQTDVMDWVGDPGVVG